MTDFTVRKIPGDFEILTDDFPPQGFKRRNMVKVKFKKLTETAIVPEYKSAEAAGMDICSDEDLVIDTIGSLGSNRALVKTGIAIELPVGYEAQVRPRSGLAYKNGVTVLNSPGTVDSDFRGNIGVILINHGHEKFVVKKGDRIAQLVISSVSRAEMVEVEKLDESDRGTGGFGSTGK